MAPDLGLKERGLRRGCSGTSPKGRCLEDGAELPRGSRGQAGSGGGRWRIDFGSSGEKDLPQSGLSKAQMLLSRRNETGCLRTFNYQEGLKCSV